ncbi:MAG TPA: hypothetical protein VI074_02460, partial [Propionibacteriaceae bacterium]
MCTHIEGVHDPGAGSGNLGPYLGSGWLQPVWAHPAGHISSIFATPASAATSRGPMPATSARPSAYASAVSNVVIPASTAAARTFGAAVRR